MGRIARTPEDLVAALKDHLCLLVDHIERLESGEDRYYKAIAVELRVLVHSGRGNNLLFRVAGQHGIDPMVIKDGREVSLRDYLGEVVFITPVPVGHPQPSDSYLTRSKFIAKAAQQEGGAHEDDALDTDYLDFGGRNPNDLFYGLTSDGQSPHIRQAIRTGRCVHECGVRVLGDIR